MSDDRIFSVSALTAAIKTALEAPFAFVWVRGQVSNLARPASGHMYFSLRDESCSLAAVWFKNSQKQSEHFDPLTGEVYEEGPRPGLAGTLENGQEVVCAGKLTVYGARGQYQLVVEIAQPAGIGRLHEEFERLKAKLAGLGYFSLARKRPLPENPLRVAVLTAPGGAAVHDFLRIAEGRGTSAHIRIFPVPVQGEAAPARIVTAMHRVFDEQWAQTLVLIRGGGSLEDLWAFNDETLAGAVFTAPIPVLAGIGHEVDFTLADMTADVRAATPSHAAQLLWTDREELRRRAHAIEEALRQTERQSLERLDTQLKTLARALIWRSPEKNLAHWQDRLLAGTRLLRNAGRRILERKESRLSACLVALYAAPQRIPAAEQAFTALARQLTRAGSRLLETHEAALRSYNAGLMHVPSRLPAVEAALATLERQLHSNGLRGLTETAHTLERLNLRLEGANPHAPLERGYVLLRKEDGSFVKARADAVPGERLSALVSDGEIPVRVETPKDAAHVDTLP